MKKAEQKKCYFYTRVSTEIQVDGYSLEAQLAELEKEAKHRGYICAHHYTDEGKSGKNTKNRDDFREIIKDIIEMENEFFGNNDEGKIAEQQADLECLKKLYAQKEKSKNKFFEKMQNLDSSDLNYDMKYDDLERL